MFILKKKKEKESELIKVTLGRIKLPETKTDFEADPYQCQLSNTLNTKYASSYTFK